MKANKKVLGAAAALTMSLAMAAGSTFAWFTTGNSVKIDTITMEVKSSTAALRISAGSEDGYKTGYKTTLTSDEILQGNGYYTYDNVMYHYENKDNLFIKEEKHNTDSLNGYYKRGDDGAYTKLGSDATVDGSTNPEGPYYKFNTDNLYTATRSGSSLTEPTAVPDSADYSSSSTYWTKVELDAVTSADGKSFTYEGGSTPAVRGSYVTLTFNFKISEGGDYSVYLLDDNVGGGYESYVRPYDGGPVKSVAYKGEQRTDYGKTIEANTAIATRAAYATRLSFVEGDTNKGIWAPYDKSYGTEQTGPVEAGYEVNSGSFWKNNLAEDYRAYFESEGSTWPGSPATDKNPVNGSIVFKTSAEDTTTDATAICALNDNSGEGSVTVHIWIEGKDGDCFNSILTDKFNVKMAFAAFKA